MRRRGDDQFTEQVEAQGNFGNLLGFVFLTATLRKRVVGVGGGGGAGIWSGLHVCVEEVVVTPILHPAHRLHLSALTCGDVVG